MGVASNGKRFVLMRVVHFHRAGGRETWEINSPEEFNVGEVQSRIYHYPPSSSPRPLPRFFSARFSFTPLVPLVVSGFS